jgi:tetratricopeptide (TPR) repeat protein
VISGAFVVLTLVSALAFAAAAAPKNPPQAPSPAASGSPGPLPTATPEPPSIAIPRLEAKLKSDPNDRDTMSQLASYYVTVGRPDMALPLTQKLLSVGTKTAQVYYLDGVANQQVGRIKEATEDLEQASNLEPTNSQVLLTLTDLYLRTNRPADAERVAKRATTFNPNDQRALINYGLVLAQEKKYDEARAQFEAAAKIDPKDATPIILEAKSYEDQSAFAFALQTYDRALVVDPKSGDALLGKARLLVAQHQVKEAAAVYEKLLPLLTSDDEKATVVAEEARAYASDKQTAQAEVLYKRAISDYPKSLVGHVAYGDYLAATGNYGQAEAEWTTGLGPNRDNREALLRLGEYYMRRNNAQKSIEMYSRLVELAPNDPSALALLGQAYSYNRQFEKSRDAFRKAFEIGHSPAALAGLGTADYEVRNYRESAQIFEAIDRAAPDLFKQNPQLLFVMAKAYAATNQNAKAKVAYTRFLAFVKPNSSAATQVKKLIASLDAKPASKPTAKPTARPGAKPAPSPSPTPTAKH